MKDNVNYNAVEGHFAEDLLYHFLEWFKRLWIIILLLAVLLSGLLSAYTYVTYVPKYSASATASSSAMSTISLFFMPYSCSRASASAPFPS